jgi:nicotinate-nucleotide--dimethylbenzimidazole phosphoribosyltransferase
MASHLSTEPGHRVALEHLGLTPFLDLKMRLGEGTGAALGLFLLETACRLQLEMATFTSAGVSQRQTRRSS